MNDTIGFVVVGIFIIGLIYGLLKQIQHTIRIQKANKPNNRLLFANYLTCFALIGFIVSYGLNVLVGIQEIQSKFITSNNTSFSCSVFLALLLISRFIITPKY